MVDNGWYVPCFLFDFLRSKSRSYHEQWRSTRDTLYPPEGGRTESSTAMSWNHEESLKSWCWSENRLPIEHIEHVHDFTWSNLEGRNRQYFFSVSTRRPYTVLACSCQFRQPEAQKRPASQQAGSCKVRVCEAMMNNCTDTFIYFVQSGRYIMTICSMVTCCFSFKFANITENHPLVRFWDKHHATSCKLNGVHKENHVHCSFKPAMGVCFLFSGERVAYLDEFGGTNAKVVRQALAAKICPDCPSAQVEASGLGPWEVDFKDHAKHSISVHGIICDFRQDPAAWYERYAGAAADYYKRYMDKDLPWGSLVCLAVEFDKIWRMSWRWESNGVNMKTTFRYTLLNTPLLVGKCNHTCYD